MTQCKQCGNTLMAGQHICEVCGTMNENDTVARPTQRLKVRSANPHEQGVQRGIAYNAQNCHLNERISSGYTFPTYGQNGAYTGAQGANNANYGSPYFQEMDGRNKMENQREEQSDKKYKLQVGIIIAVSVLFVVLSTLLWLRIYGFIG